MKRADRISPFPTNFSRNFLIAKNFFTHLKKVQHLNWDLFQGKFGFEGFFQVNRHAPKKCILPILNMCTSQTVCCSVPILQVAKMHLLYQVSHNAFRLHNYFKVCTSDVRKAVPACCLSRNCHFFPVLKPSKSEALSFRATPPENSGSVPSALPRVKAQLLLWLTSVSTIYYSNSSSSTSKKNKIPSLFMTDDCSDMQTDAGITVSVSVFKAGELQTNLRR